MGNTIFGKNLVSGPYERLFFKPGEEKPFIKNYIEFLGGEIEYFFRIEEYFNLLVVGLISDLGNVSLVSIEPENFEKLPEYIRNTQTLFVVDSIDEVYETAKNKNIPILQPRTPNIMGAQGRLELAPGYIIELAETTNQSLFNQDISLLNL